MKKYIFTLLIFFIAFSLLAQEKTKEFPYYGLESVNLEKSLQYYQINPEFEKIKMSGIDFVNYLKYDKQAVVSEYFQKIDQGYIENKITPFQYWILFLAPQEALNTSHTGIISGWVEKNPDSFYANLIAGSFFIELGGQARGGNWASETTEDQFDLMRRFFEKSEKYLNKAMELKPNHEIPYLIKMTSSSSRNEIDQLAEEAKKIIPNSYLFFNQYMYKLTPRWFGNYVDMQAFALEIQEGKPESSRFRVLLGYVAADMASGFYASKDYKNAIKYYDMALFHGAFGDWIEQRRNSYFYLKDYAGALEDTLLLDKIQRDSASLRKSVMVKHKNDRPFIVEVEKLKKSKDDKDGMTVFSLGTYFVMQKDHPEVAEDLFAHAINKNPKSDVYYEWYVDLLYKNKSKEFPNALSDYITLCDSIECKSAGKLQGYKELKKCIDQMPECRMPKKEEYEHWIQK